MHRRPRSRARRARNGPPDGSAERGWPRRTPRDVHAARRRPERSSVAPGPATEQDRGLAAIDRVTDVGGHQPVHRRLALDVALDKVDAAVLVAVGEVADRDAAVNALRA